MATFFDHDDAGPHLSEFACGNRGVALARQKLRFFFVNNKEIYAFQQALQVGACGVDPEVEGVGEDEGFVLLLLCQLVDNVVLKGGLDRSQHDVWCAFIIRRELGRKFVEYVELDLEGVAAFEVLPIAAGPVECFSCGIDLQALGVDTVFF